ncbi:MAG: phosphoribosylformylglycinamidine synthase subunit PurQ [Bacillota bacterium]
MNSAVISFPGSNCDHDVIHALNLLPDSEADYISSDSKTSLDEYDLIVLPGGFSYGDYLRSGAVARFTPKMEEVIRFAHNGGLVLGICNGFQVLLEAKLLPGAMRPNKNLKFICQHVALRVENENTAFTTNFKQGETIELPIAHQEGSYYIDPAGLTRLKSNQQIILRYENPNPNGSVDNIAAVCNEAGNVLGMMPHPERAVENIDGHGYAGRSMFQSIIKFLRSNKSDRVGVNSGNNF